MLVEMSRRPNQAGEHVYLSRRTIAHRSFALSLVVHSLFHKVYPVHYKLLFPSGLPLKTLYPELLGA